MKTKEDILKTEYSLEFDELRKNRMATSFYKYGPVKENYGGKLVDCIENLIIRLEKYNETGNAEYLADVANFAMVEFMYPQHPKAHFKATDSDKSPGLTGMTFREIEALNK